MKGVFAHQQPDAGEGYLRTLFVEDMVNQLTTEALNAIRPKVEETARRIVAEMAPEVASHFNLMKNATVVEFSMRGSK